MLYGQRAFHPPLVGGKILKTFDIVFAQMKICGSLFDQPRINHPIHSQPFGLSAKTHRLSENKINTIFTDKLIPLLGGS